MAINEPCFCGIGDGRWGVPLGGRKDRRSTWLGKRGSKGWI